MHKTDAANNVSGEFSDGTPPLTPGTSLGAKWHNTVQRELVNVVEAAGITLDTGNDGQVLEALEALGDAQGGGGPGRLTLTTAVPVTTGDVTGATTVYYTPYNRAWIKLYNGTRWQSFALVELSQTTADTTKSPTAVANNSNYDVFVWNDAGTLRATRGPAWASDTTRGTGAGTTELEFFGGRYVNKVAVTNGPAARRGLYVGTVRSDGSAQINDSFAKRHVWNMHNRVSRPMRVIESANAWNYTTLTFQQANANAANQLDFVVGLEGVSARADVHASFRNSDASGANAVVGIGLDSTTTLAVGCINSYANSFSGHVNSTGAAWNGYPGLGRHTLVWLEASSATGTTTWSGDEAAPAFFQAGVHGELLG